MSAVIWADMTVPLAAPQPSPNSPEVANFGQNGELWAVCKGSPEAIFQLLSDTDKAAVAPWYEETYSAMAKQGMRVIALGYKKIEKCSWKRQLDPQVQQRVRKMGRDEIESDLSFAGFLAFRCLLRKDSRAVVRELRRGGHQVIMITGDAALTGAHVAGEVDITSDDKAKLALLVPPQEDSVQHVCRFERLDNGELLGEIKPEAIKDLAAKYDLCLTGHALTATSHITPAIWDHLYHFKVMARMGPEQKERVMTSLANQGHSILMCGDGTNDVGALKQAHVGIALLCGFGSKNADDPNAPHDPTAPANPQPNPKTNPKTSTGTSTSTGAEGGHDEDSPLRPNYKLAANALGGPSGVPLGAPKDPKKLAEWKEKQEFLKKDIEERKARGESFAEFKARFALAKREAEEIQRKRMEEMERKAKGLPPKKDGESDQGANKTVKPDLNNLFDALENADEGEMEMIKLGDASIAAPFTSKMPSICSAVDIVRQGRCTLVTALQMYQILALNSLISAHSLSVLYLEGIKYGDKQMTIIGLLVTTAFFMLTRAQPLERLSPIPPPKSIFEPGLFISLLGQFAIHIGTMTTALWMARSHLGPEWKPDLEGQFSPNLINSVVFLLSAIQQVSVFAVNHKGPPFMEGLTDNKAFMNALVAILVGSVVCASEVFPHFNAWIELVPMPDATFRYIILFLILTDAIASFLWDRLMQFIFLPAMFKASLSTMKNDMRVLGKMVMWISFLIYILVS